MNSVLGCISAAQEFIDGMVGMWEKVAPEIDQQFAGELEIIDEEKRSAFQAFREGLMEAIKDVRRRFIEVSLALETVTRSI